MGRERKSEKSRTVDAGEPLRATKGRRLELLDYAGLKTVWRSAGCVHETAAGVAYASRVIIRCDDCGVVMFLRLVFGRPKRFHVEIYPENGARGPFRAMRLVGYSSARTAADFIHDTAPMLSMSEDGANPNGRSPRQDDAMLEKLVETLYIAGPYRNARSTPAADFVGAWSGINCEHSNAVCQITGSRIILECLDCAAEVQFGPVGGGFNAIVMRKPLHPVPYGRHGAAAAVDFIRMHAKTLLLPDPVADRMSDDPERDAQHVSRIVSMLERAGTLRRVPVNRGDPELDAKVAKLSVLNCPRDKFDRMVGVAERKRASAGAKSADGRKRFGPQYHMEAMRLAWPHWYEGVGMVDVAPYDSTGNLECCVRCGFSTLDDPVSGTDSWRRGCPECGYFGFLLDME